jgi:hypothetical protein
MDVIALNTEFDPLAPVPVVGAPPAPTVTAYDKVGFSDVVPAK